MYFSDIICNNSLFTLYSCLYYNLFSCLCMVGIADAANLLVLALVTQYFSGFLVFTVCSDKGNMSDVMSFLVHLSANFLLSWALLAFNVWRFVR